MFTESVGKHDIMLQYKQCRFLLWILISNIAQLAHRVIYLLLYNDYECIYYYIISCVVIWKVLSVHIYVEHTKDLKCN